MDVTVLEETNQIKNRIASILKVAEERIDGVVRMKKGMTNSSYLFVFDGHKYIFRVPGEGTDKLIDREHEYEVYSVIKKYDLCDDVVYIDPHSGYKITKYYDFARVCDPDSEDDVRLCIGKLKAFHNLKLKVSHSFDIFSQIEYYEQLRGVDSTYADYDTVKEQVFSLRDYIEDQPKDCCLSHIDAVPDNFLITNDHGIRLIDWEYSGMQDPDVDLAMFGIYSEYNQEMIDRLIDIYHGNECESNRRIKIYCYIAACGLLWSNWCEYKHSLGIVFGDYAISQYNYAREYYQLARKGMGR